MSAASGSPIRRDLLASAFRGGVVGLLFLIAFPAVTFVMASYEGWGATISTSAWDLGFAVLLGLAAGPLAFVEARAARREGTAARHAAWSGLILILATLLFAAAYLQITYAFARLEGQDAAQTLGGIGSDAWEIVLLWSESRVLFACYAPAFALVALGRLRRWRLRTQILVATVGTLAAYYVSLVGYETAPPIVRWLVGSSWADPILGTFVYLLPVILGVSLPVVGYASDRLDRRLSRPEQNGTEALAQPSL